jgi:hypothetical protein
MDSESKVKASEAGALLAGPAMSAEEATARLRRWRMKGIVPTVGRAGERDSKLDAFLFDKSAVAILAVLFWCFDHGGIRTNEQLAQIYRFLAESDPKAGGGVPAIDHVLGDILTGGAPMLVLTRWGGPAGDVQTSCVLRFTDEYERPIEGPTSAHVVLADVVLNLAHHLERIADVIQPVTRTGTH